MSRIHHTITEIVATVYCEQKTVFDATVGDARPDSVREKTRQGVFEHLRFEVEGRTQAAIDKRCFIATQVYGADAPETVLLRAWRDAVLMQYMPGRMFVWFYYVVSPALVRLIVRLPAFVGPARAMLSALVNRIGRRWPALTGV